MSERWTTPEANDISRIVHAFSDKPRRDEVRKLADQVEARILSLQALAEEWKRLRKDAYDTMRERSDERDKLRAVAFTLRQALKDYYHECRCRHADMDSVNIAAYKALQDAEKLL